MKFILYCILTKSSYIILFSQYSLVQAAYCYDFPYMVLTCLHVINLSFPLHQLGNLQLNEFFCQTLRADLFFVSLVQVLGITRIDLVGGAEKGYLQNR